MLNAGEKDVEEYIETSCYVNGTTYQCPLCDYICSDRRRLKIHSSLKHKGENDYKKWKVSSKLFKKNKDESKCLKCTVCDFKSTSDKEMRIHKFRIHRLKMKKVSSSSDVKAEEEIILEDDEFNEEIR